MTTNPFSKTMSSSRFRNVNKTGGSTGDRRARLLEDSLPGQSSDGSGGGGGDDSTQGDGAWNNFGHGTNTNTRSNTNTDSSSHDRNRSEMPSWLQNHYNGMSTDDRNNPGSDGYFTSGNDLYDTLMGEAGQMQDAADRHYGRVLERENEYGNFLDGIQGRYEDSRVDTSMNPEDYASVQRAEQEYNAFEDRTAQDISSTIAGHQAQFQTQQDAVNSGMRPDGSMMTAAEQTDARFGLNQQMGVGRQQAVNTIMSTYNQQKSALGMQVAGLTGQAEQLRQQGQIINAGNQIKAMELENSGRNALAQLTLNNPETVVSILGGLMSLNEMGASMATLFGSQQWNDENNGFLSIDELKESYSQRWRGWNDWT